MSFKKDVYIDAPIDKVFEIATDYNHAPAIMDNVIEVEKVTDGPLQTGTKIKEVREIRGRRAESILVVVDYIPHAKYTVKSEHNGVEIEYQYAFSSQGNGTTVHFEGIIHASDFKNKLFKPILRRILKKEDEDHLEKLKAFIEESE